MQLNYKTNFRIVFIATIFFGHIFALSAQENYKTTVDSLLHNVDKKDLSNLESLSSLLHKTPKNTVRNLFNYAITKDSSDLARAFIYKGFASNLSNQGLVDESLQYRFNGLKLAEKLELTNIKLYYHTAIANAFHFKNQLDSATYHLNIVEALAEGKYNSWLSQVYYNRALIQESLNNNEEAAYYYEQLWHFVKKNKKSQGFPLYIVTEFYIKQPNYLQEKAKYLDLLANYYQKKNTNLPKGHIPIESIFKDQISAENIDKFKSVIHISDSLGKINSFHYTSKALAQTYSKQQEYNKAIFYLKKSEKKLLHLQKPLFLLEIYELLSQNYRLTKDYKNGIKYQEKAFDMQKRLSSDKVKKNIAELEVKYDSEKKDKEIASQSLALTKKKNQQIKLIGGLIGVLILLLLSALFFYKRLEYQKTISLQKESLHEQKIKELNQQNKLIALNSMVEGQEKERIRIAKDLHDGLGGLLSSVKAHFVTLQKLIGTDEQPVMELRTNSLIEDACIEVRRISHNMMPHALTIAGLPAVLQDMADDLIVEGFEVELDINNFPNTMLDNKQATIFRLIQELISNIKKHALAKSILIQLFCVDKSLSLIVEDDGRGFDYHQAYKKAGIGLKNITSRVAFLNGSIDWDTAKLKGTTVTINIPL